MRERIYGGGPAFPIPGKVAHYDEGTFEDAPFAGMTLRDYFAAKAMQGAMASFINGAPADAETDAKIFKAAYMIADAMIAARDGT